MKRSNSIIRGSQVAAAVTLALAAQAAMADYNVYLRACEYTKNFPTATGTEAVTMWGYEVHPNEGAAEAAQTAGNCNAGAPPVIRVPAAENGNLHISLWNGLPGDRDYLTSTSVYLPGQRKALTPTRWVGGEYDGRIRSFDSEVDPGEHETFEFQWQNANEGTYLFHSGTHPQLQVQMGLYGVVVVEGGTAAAPEAYPGIVPAHDAVLIYSEVDPAVHAAVGSNTYGPNQAMTSTINYAPRWFLINGEPYTGGNGQTVGGPGGIAPPYSDGGNIRTGETVLLRLVNAGLESHALQLLGAEMEVIAEDGHLKAVTSPSSSVLLPAGAARDALFIGSRKGDYPLYDRGLRLVNDTATPGGMYAKVHVQNGNDLTSPPPVTAPDLFYVGASTSAWSATNWSTTEAAPGVLANDTGAGALDVYSANGIAIANASANGAAVFEPAGVTGASMRVFQAGRVDFRPPNPATSQWTGVAPFSYRAVVHNASLPGQDTPVRVVMDQWVTPTFHNPQGTANDRWDLSGTLRVAPTGTVTIAWEANSNNANCSIAPGTVIASVAATGTTWAYQQNTPNTGGCNRISVSADLPASDGVPAHTSKVTVNVNRVNP